MSHDGMMGISTAITESGMVVRSDQMNSPEPESENPMLAPDDTQEGLSDGYVRMNNGDYGHGQIIKFETYERWKKEGRAE